MKNLSYLFVLLSVLGIVGCKTKFDQEKLQKINRVAIVAFEGGLKAEEGDTGALSFKDVVNIKDAVKDTVNKYQGDTELSGKLYQILSKKFSRDLEWQLLDLEGVTKNEYYETLYSKYHQQLIPGAFKLDGLLRIEAKKLKHEERQKLIRELDVDAIVLLGFHLYPSQRSSLLGVTSIARYKSNVDMDVYVAGVEAPVWKVTQKAGESSDGAVRSWFGVSVKSQLDSAVVSAVENAVNNMLVEYKSQN